jgi:hypothetical protein
MVNEEFISQLSLQIGLTALIAYMGWIVYDLAKGSKAGRFGTFVMFGALGLGVFGFMIKGILNHLLSP